MNSDENKKKTAQYFPIHIMLKMAHSLALAREYLSKRGAYDPMAPSRLNAGNVLIRLFFCDDTLL